MCRIKNPSLDCFVGSWGKLLNCYSRFTLAWSFFKAHSKLFLIPQGTWEVVHEPATDTFGNAFHILFPPSACFAVTSDFTRVRTVSLFYHFSTKEYGMELLLILTSFGSGQQSPGKKLKEEANPLCRANLDQPRPHKRKVWRPTLPFSSHVSLGMCNLGKVTQPARVSLSKL